MSIPIGADLTKLPPGVVPTDGIAAPGGGYWIMGRDGGVFSIQGAPFFGSYPGLAPDQRQGNRSFTKIVPGQNGGYTLISDRGETYDFAGKGSGNQGPQSGNTPAVGDTQTATEQADELKTSLDRFGLGDLYPWARGLLDSGFSNAYILNQLPQQDAYKKRFPALSARQQAGHAPITEQQYIDWEQGWQKLGRVYGLPQNFYDSPDDVAKFIAGDVSLPELEGRIQEGVVKATSADSVTKKELQRLYNVNEGDITAYYIDKGSLPEIQRQLAAASVGAAAVRTGYGELSSKQLEELVAQGVSAGQAQQGFNQLGLQKELLGTLPGENPGDISQADQLGATFGGNADAQKAIDAKKRTRQATFEKGGGPASTQQGVTGLGQAT